MGRWVTSKGRRIYIPDEGEKNPFAQTTTKSKESFVVDYDLQKHLDKKGKAEETKRKNRELADEADAYDREHKEGPYSKTIADNEAQKEKQMAANKKQAEKASGKKSISPKAMKVAELAKKKLVFSDHKDGHYAEISENHWRYAGVSDEKVIEAMNASDTKYSYELKHTQEKGNFWTNGAPIHHYRIYRRKK